ncbi:helix-turn-helix transcriptional regulator [Phytoactinopolyspora endophytica]|uniref:helix-turn-helix transcriptional regulator n=1 Tax=Phytoactinopolyspora endophytica TaxID=1642495 RepID=UPI00101C2521|nr:YafY family protein [Phytoactinopolyspora endophytica]
MANTSSRMLRLLSLLQTHRYWPGGDLAERLDVSERTLRRDIDRLRELGYPIEASRGVAGGYQLQAGAALPPLLLDDDEAVAIAVGLTTGSGGAVDGIEETSVRALAKIVQVMPPKLRRRVDALQAATVPAVWGGGPTVDAEALAVIALTCRDSERLRFRYTTRAGDEASRLVEPHQMVSLGRRWYLVAWDLGRADWRTFRVDRLVDPFPTGVRFQPRELPSSDAATFVRESLASIPTQYQVEVVIQAPAADVANVVRQWATVEPIDDASCRMLMNVDDLSWPALVLGALGAEFDVVNPPELRAHLRTTAALFSRSTAV